MNGTGFFTAVGGIGAMIGGLAAWRAASASGQAARDARDALAASLKPLVELNFEQDGERAVARAVVLGRLSPLGVSAVESAADVVVQIVTASGRQSSSLLLATLEPNSSSRPRELPFLEVGLGTLSEDWPPPAGDHVVATVSFSDMRRLARYTRVRQVDLHRASTPGSISFQNQTESVETKLPA
jgi:hypothetical protein